MAAILECVPNISEGQDLATINRIVDVVKNTKEVHLLHVDIGESANRTVITFAGKPEAVVEAAFSLIKQAAESIDMRKHTGIHPRMGATDVCPLIPISGMDMDEAVRYVHLLGKRVGEDLKIPVYLYEYAASREERKNLAHIRSGEYEGFKKKILLPDWKPDYGPATFQPQAGQTVIGARDFLVAYNMNLNTDSVSIAKAIAADIRESGRMINQNGIRIRQAGSCKSVKAIGWYVPEYACAQVSTNLTRLSDTPLHLAFEATKKAANKRGVEVTGSELIGLIPRQSLLDAGKYFAQKTEPHIGQPKEADLVKQAVKSLGLDELAPFLPQQKVIEYLLAKAM